MLKKGSIADWITRHKDDFESVEGLIDAAVAEMKTTRRVVTSVISKLRAKGVAIKRSDGRCYRLRTPDAAPQLKGGLTKDQFRDQHDATVVIRRAIREGLPSLEDERIVSDVEFRNARCGGAAGGGTMTQGWRQVSGEPEFLSHQFRHKNRTFWAAKSVVKWVLANVSGTKEA